MITRTINQRATNINDWLDKIDSHWQGDGSNINNNTNFWSTVFHDMTTQDHEDFVEVVKQIQRQHPGAFARWSSFNDDIAYIEKQLRLGKAVIKPMVKGANTPVFRSWMRVRDVTNGIFGSSKLAKPTISKPKSISKTQPSKPSKPTKPGNTFNDLFDID
jgi:hypothetical protein